MTKSDLRRKQRVRTDGVYSVCWEGSDGISRSVEGEAIDLSASGIRIRCGVTIAAETEVFVEGRTRSVSGHGTVRHCTPSPDGNFIGVEFRSDASVPIGDAPELDYYEFMQISPKAGYDVIHRVYRFMAARFHPDNPDTGDIEKFLALNRVYDTLSDPDLRSNYDVKREQLEAAPDPIFSMSTFVNGIEGEVNRRLAILAMLYNKRRTNGSQPGISLWDLERKMALPREHLEFAVWYLKAKGYLAMGDNADLTLTASGVDYVETNADRNVTLDKLLHAGSKSPIDSSHGKRKSEADNTPHHLIAAQSKLDNDKKQQPGYTNGTVPAVAQNLG